MFKEEIKKLFIKNNFIYISLCLIILSCAAAYFGATVPADLSGGRFGVALNSFPNSDFYLWQKLLSSEGINIYAFIISLSVGVSLTVPEYRNGINHLLSVSKCGKTRLPAIKLLTGITVCFVCCLCILISEPLVTFLKLGLKNGSAPLGALPAYVGVTKNLTVFQALIFKIFFQIFGYCCLCVIAMTAVSVCRGKVTAALTGVVLTLLLPLYLGNTPYNKERFLLLPLPLSPILSCKYLSPTIADGNSDRFIFTELSITEITAVNSALFFITAICALIFIYFFPERRRIKK